MTLRNLGCWPTKGGWALCAIAVAWLVLFSGIDPGSTILFALAIPGIAVALICVGYAVEVRELRGRLVWLGRALAFFGAAFTVSFPAQLYQEILTLESRGQAPAGWYPRAIWYSAATIPLVLVPALVSLRWPRLAGTLFVVAGIFNAAESVYHPFGVTFPEMTTDSLTLTLASLPVFVTAALLIAGGTARAGGQRARTITSADARRPGPATP